MRATQDAKRLSELHAQCFESAWDEASWQSLLTAPHSYAWVSEDEQCFAAVRVAEETADLLSIGTLPDARRQGHAKQMLLHIEAFLRPQKVQKIILEVSVKNEAAIAFYHSLNYTTIHTREGYYATPQGKEDAIVMAKVL